MQISKQTDKYFLYILNLKSLLGSSCMQCSAKIHHLSNIHPSMGSVNSSVVRHWSNEPKSQGSIPHDSSNFFFVPCTWQQKKHLLLNITLFVGNIHSTYCCLWFHHLPYLFKQKLGITKNSCFLVSRFIRFSLFFLLASESLRILCHVISARIIFKDTCTKIC